MSGMFDQLIGFTINFIADMDSFDIDSLCLFCCPKSPDGYTCVMCDYIHVSYHVDNR